jgi:NAD(P)-dependent dehydrogenase (short-subunit alcohol dehydrogenase family)
MSNDLDGTAAIVTGGASGIGAEIVRLLRSRGADVVFGDLNDDAGVALATETGATYQRTDVTDVDACAALVARCTESFGGLDYAFCNAGILGRDIEEQFSGATWDPIAAGLDRYRAVMAVNVDGVVHTMNAAIPAMRTRGGGGIVATASIAGIIDYSADPYYVASKHAVVGYVRALAANLRDDNITVNAICPGGVATPMTKLGEDANSDIFVQPSAIAEAQVDAALTDASGQCYTVVARHGVTQHEFNRVRGF